VHFLDAAVVNAIEYCAVPLAATSARPGVRPTAAAAVPKGVALRATSVATRRALSMRDPPTACRKSCGPSRLASLVSIRRNTNLQRVDASLARTGISLRGNTIDRCLVIQPEDRRASFRDFQRISVS
jgi:hypothetical protein